MNKYTFSRLLPPIKCTDVTQNMQTMFSKNIKMKYV